MRRDEEHPANAELFPIAMPDPTYDPDEDDDDKKNSDEDDKLDDGNKFDEEEEIVVHDNQATRDVLEILGWSSFDIADVRIKSRADIVWMAPRYVNWSGWNDCPTNLHRLWFRLISAAFCTKVSSFSSMLYCEQRGIFFT